MVPPRRTRAQSLAALILCAGAFCVAPAAPCRAQRAPLPSPHQFRHRSAPSNVVPVDYQAPTSAAPAPAQAPAQPPAETVAPGPRVPQPEMSLEDLEQIALANHPTLRGAVAAVEAAEGRTWQAGLYPNPQVASSSPQLAGNNSQYNVYVTQTLVTAGKLRLDAAAASGDIARARWALIGARYDVLTDLRDAFYATLVAENRVVVIGQLVEIATRSTDTTQRMLEAGEAARGDVLLLAVERDRAKLAVANAQATLIAARRQLAIAAGVPRMDIARVTGDLLAPLPQIDLAAMQEFVAANHPQIQAARTVVGRNRAQLERELVEPIPDIQFQGGYQRQVEPAQDQGLFQVALNVPLWDRNQGAIVAAQASVAEARADALASELDLTEQAAAAWADYEAARQQVVIYQNDILPKARETLRLEQRLHGAGETNFLRLLATQQTLTQSELAALDAQASLWKAANRIAWFMLWDDLPRVENAPQKPAAK